MIPRIVILLLLALAPALAQADPQWLTLPPTPSLPQPAQSGSAPVNGIHMWYAAFGADQGEPVILLHGGLANSDYWGNQVRALMNRYRVIVMDSRGHGRINPQRAALWLRSDGIGRDRADGFSSDPEGRDRRLE